MMFIQILKKNFKLLMHSKTSALIIFLGPLLLMLLISLAFNSSSLYGLKVGAYSESHSELSNSIIEKLEDDAFTVTRMNTEQECINSVKEGTTHICAVFPPDLDVTSEGDIIFHVDKSRMNIVYSIMGSISSKISTKSTELSTILTTKLINALQKTEEVLSSEEGDITILKTNLLSIKNSIIETESDMDMMNIANFSLLEQELEDVKGRFNDSRSAFSDLDDVVELISLDVQTTMATANSSLAAIKKARLDLTEEISNARKLQEAMSEIKTEMDNIEIKDVQKIVSPVSTKIEPLSSEGTHLKFSFPTLLLMVLMFAGIFLASTIVIEEKKSKAHFRNFITPTRDFTHIISDYLFCLVVLLIQTIIIFGVMTAITKTFIPLNTLPNLVIALLLISTAFIFIGMTIGYAFKDEETANIGSISIATILLFFSNTILPIESLPTAIKNIVSLNPFVVGESILRRVYLFNETLINIPLLMGFIIAYVAIFIILTAIFRKATKMRIE